MRLIDEATEAKSDAVGKLAKEMKNINGVNGVLVANLFGEILMEEGIANGKRASAAMAFAMRKIEKLGRASKMGTLKVALTSGKSDKKLLSKYHDDVVDVNVDLKASTDVIEQTLEKMKSGS
jgi:predicted regulator of Ras-like GTPase activity (Roadblock/LC7/MglB family)